MELENSKLVPELFASLLDLNGHICRGFNVGMSEEITYMNEVIIRFVNVHCFIRRSNECWKGSLIDERNDTQRHFAGIFPKSR